MMLGSLVFSKGAMVMRKFEYGDIVIDEVTGYMGTVTAYAYYYDKSPAQYLVETKESTGRPVQWWFDENRLSPTESVE